MGDKINEFVLQQIIPNYFAFFVERKMRNDINQMKKKDYQIHVGEGQKVNNLLRKLNKYNQKEIDRRKLIEDKAKASLFIITIAITVILGSVNIMLNNPNKINIGFIKYIILISAIIYFCIAGLTSIKVISIEFMYDIYIDDISSEQECRIIISEDNNDMLDRLYKNIKLNGLTTMIKSNYAYATYIGIRNGILLISLFFVMMVGYMYIVMIIAITIIMYNYLKKLFSY